MISQNLTRSQSDRLKASIKATYDESKPGTSLNKCIRFCYELKAGDIAVIVDNNRVAFAYIGEYYEEQSPTLTVELEKEVHQQIEKANPNTDTFTCPYIKRRKITLIKVLTADDTISPYLQSAIARNWHSLSDLNEYAELVLSGCFDTVLFKDKLTVTFRVKRKEEINVLDLANFVLCAARLLSDDKPETVQVKTTLHSPGDGRSPCHCPGTGTARTGGDAETAEKAGRKLFLRRADGTHLLPWHPHRHLYPGCVFYRDPHRRHAGGCPDGGALHADPVPAGTRL